jgi:hypothetical protein
VPFSGGFVLLWTPRLSSPSGCSIPARWSPSDDDRPVDGTRIVGARIPAFERCGGILEGVEALRDHFAEHPDSLSICARLARDGSTPQISMPL